MADERDPPESPEGEDSADDFLDDAMSGGVWAVEGEKAVQPPETPSTAPPDEAYISAQPGAATRVAFSTAGIYRRQRSLRIWAAVIGVVVASLLGSITLDVLGVWTIPGMGLVYDATGWEDPSVERAMERTEEKLEQEDLDPAERAHLRDVMLGLKKRSKGRAPKPTKKSAVSKQGIADAPPSENRDLLSQIMSGEDGKKQHDVKLPTPDQLSTPPDLPEGLSGEAIFAVISERSRSIRLCIAESMRAGENLSGRMDVEMTIDVTGDVTKVKIAPAEFSRSTLGACTVKNVKRWKFPRFNGDEVTVMFPFVVGQGF